ncbi:zinc-dependent alcohol dehydrogenase [Piscinibacter sakaiensis]|uniref:Threonine dehydrogenase n=1 Tax=Piscinibacter sakaiensis TaxID=1547922 RepID=A0A0K8P977_PISS1|nr:zinc-dependent alcohol dehydrogenase [Piscinibacter sakaiensis]GAP38745.1 threonine dehydrogenase [Piscinibacter sakaiensis]
MKALTYHGRRDVRVESVPEPHLLAEDDLLLRVTATAICGSDLHIYRGRLPGMRSGDILGHEFMGIVEEVGPGVTRLERGDRVVVPFTISCGDCFFCTRRLLAACERSNDGRGTLMNRKRTRSGAAMFGYSHLYGGHAGGQAEYVRVPRANVGPLRIADSTLRDEQVLFLSDILPTGYQACLNARIGPGSTVAIFGAGPVGMMAAACARWLGAQRLFMIDEDPRRLAHARETCGATTLDFASVDDPADLIIGETDGRGVDASIDAVGFEAKGSAIESALTRLRLQGSSGAVLRQAIAATRRGGVVSVPGVYAGFIHAFLFGDAFEKGLTLVGGQTHVQALMPVLLEAIASGGLVVDTLVSHRLPLSEAAAG